MSGQIGSENPFTPAGGRLRRVPPVMLTGVVMLCVGMAAASVFGQSDEKKRDEDGFVIPSDPPENTARLNVADIDKLLAQADTLIQSGRQAKAMDNIVKVLTEYSDALMTVKAQWVKTTHLNRSNDDAYEANIVFVTGYSEAKKRLSNLPPEVLDTYRVMMEPKAKNAYDQAIKTLDKQTLLQIIDNYPFTSVEDDALYVLGDLAFENGRYSQSLYYWNRILKTCPDTSLDTHALRFRIREAELLNGVPPSTFPALPDAVLKSVIIDDGRVRPADYLDGVARGASSRKRTPRLRQDPWGTFPGVRSQNAMPSDWSTKNLSPLNVRNIREMMAGALQADLNAAGTNQGDKKADGSSAAQAPEEPQRSVQFHPTVPTFSDGRLVLANDSAISVFDVANLDKPIWKESLVIQTRRGVPRSSRLTCLTVRPEYATVDGNLVYVRAGRRQLQDENAGRGFRSSEAQVQYLATALECLDMDRGGIRKWPASFVPEPVEKKIFQSEVSLSDQHDIASAPVIVGDTLFMVTIADFDGEYSWYLTAVKGGGRVGSGRQLFSTFICDGDPFYSGQSNYRNNHVPDFALPPVAYTDKNNNTFLYVVTNQGVVACVDGRSGEIVWLSAYTRADNTQGESLYPMCYPAAPRVVGDILLAMPQDSAYLYGLDRKTGEMLWAYSRKRYTLRYFNGVAAVRMERGVGEPKPAAILSGEQVLAVDVKTGRLIKSVPMDFTARMSAATGIGFVTNTHLYVPGTHALYAFSLDGFEPDPKEYRQWFDNRFSGGNAFKFPGLLAIADSDNILFFIDWNDTLKAYEKIVAARPDDPDAVLKLADVSFNVARYPRAVEHYLKAYSLYGFDRDTDAAKPGGVRGTAAAAIRRKIVEAAERADVESRMAEMDDSEKYLLIAIRYADDIERKIELIKRLADARAVAGDSAGETAAWQRLLDTCRQRLGGASDDDRETLESGVALARQEILRLVGLYGRDAVYAEEEKKAASQYTAAYTTRDPEKALGIMVDYPGSSFAPKAALLAGVLFSADGLHARAVFALDTYLRNYPDHPQQLFARKRLADDMLAMGLTAGAFRCAADLKAEFGDKTVTDEMTGTVFRIADWADALMAKAGKDTHVSPVSRRSLTLPISLKEHRAINVMTRYPVWSMEARGAFPPAYDGVGFAVALVDGNTAIIGVDGASGETAMDLLQQGVYYPGRTVWMADGSLAMLTTSFNADTLAVWDIKTYLESARHRQSSKRNAGKVRNYQTVIVHPPKGSADLLLSDGVRLFVGFMSEGRMTAYLPNPGSPHGGRLKKDWEYRSEQRVAFSAEPVVAGGHVFVFPVEKSAGAKDMTWRIVRLDSSTGKPDHDALELPRAVAGTDAVHDEKVVGFHRRPGRMRHDAAVLKAVVTPGGKLVVAREDHTLSGIDTVDMRVLWTTRFNGTISPSGFMETAGENVVFIYNKRVIEMVNAETGLVVWDRKAVTLDTVAQAFLDGDDLFVKTTNRIRTSKYRVAALLEAYDVKTGMRKWAVDVMPEWNATAWSMTRDHVVVTRRVFSDSNVAIRALSVIDRTTGVTDWYRVLLYEKPPSGSPRGMIAPEGSTPADYSALLCTTNGILALGRRRGYPAAIDVLVFQSGVASDVDTCQQLADRFASGMKADHPKAYRDLISARDLLASGRVREAAEKVAGVIDLGDRIPLPMRLLLYDMLVHLNTVVLTEGRTPVNAALFTGSGGKRADYYKKTAPTITLSGVKDLRLVLPKALPEYHGKDDCSANIWITADQRGLRLHAEVLDDVHVNPAQTEMNLHHGDAMMVYIDPESDGGLFPDQDDFEIHAGLSDSKTKPVGRYLVMFGPRDAERHDPNDISVKVTRAGKTTVYDIVIAWRELNLTPPNDGKRIGVAVLINDLDAAGGLPTALSTGMSKLDIRVPEWNVPIRLTAKP